MCTEPAHRDQARRSTLCPGDMGTAGGTHGGKGADLFDVLFVTLGAGGPPGGPSGVPEGVVILQGVLSWPRDHSLQNRKDCLPLVCSSKKGNGKDYIYSIQKQPFKPSEGSLLIFFFSPVSVSKEKKKEKLKREM